MIRFATLDDKEFLKLEIKRYYPSYLEQFQDLDASVSVTLNHPNYCWILDDKSAVRCTLDGETLEIGPFWGDIWKVIRLFREGIAWGKTKGAKILSFSSTTGYNVEPIARRLGTTSSYTVFLKEDI